MPYTLKYDDRFSRVVYPEQATIDPELCAGSFYKLSEGLNNLRLQVTSKQFTKIWSAAVAGAELLFPESHADILLLLLQAASCPIETENECFEFAASASFIRFFPDNPYIANDPAFGWYKDAWYQWGDFDTIFPDWIDNWLGGVVGELLQYEDTDILCNIESLAYISWLAFLNDGGVFPKIEIKFSGAGVVELELLKFPLGGKCIIELDGEPNILDILTSGVFDENSFVENLNRDILSFPPDEYPVVNVEIPVETAGDHTIYVVFIPIVADDETILGFGGGLRSVEMCGFSEEATVGIESIVWDGCALKSVSGGIETTIVTAEEIQACLDIPEAGGGSVGASFFAKSLDFRSPTATITTTSTTYTNVFGFLHTPTHENMLVIWKNVTAAFSTTTGRVNLAVYFNGAAGVNNSDASVQGTNGRQVAASAVFNGITPNVGHNINLMFKSEVAGTSTINDSTDWVVTILEWDDLDAIFVQDVRNLDGTLQKKIDGVWFDVVDLDALIAPVQALASSANANAAAAAAAAAAAQTTANSALTTANSAVATNVTQAAQIVSIQAVNAAQNARLDSIEDIDIPQLNAFIEDHEARIDTLEAAGGGGGGGGGNWGAHNLAYVEHSNTDFNPPLDLYDIIRGSYDAGTPPHVNPNSSGMITILANNAMRLGSCRFVMVAVNVFVNGGSSHFYVSINGEPEVEAIVTASSGNTRLAMAAVPPNPDGGVLWPMEKMQIEIRETYSGVASDWGLQNIKYYCIEYNPFDLTSF